MSRELFVLGVRMAESNYADTVAQIMRWAREGRGCYVCVANVHSVMESYDDPTFRSAMNGASMVTTDGMPLVWMLRLLGAKRATRVYGPELMRSLLDTAESEGIPVGLYGSDRGTLSDLVERLTADRPGLRLTFVESPPFRPPTAEESDVTRKAITESGVRIVLVGLGCPKQERWMAENSPHIPVVAVGVGAAFDFLAGTKRKAPRIMQVSGLEWLFRLVSEPRRLWRRYAYHNPRFVGLAMLQLGRAATRKLVAR